MTTGTRVWTLNQCLSLKILVVPPDPIVDLIRSFLCSRMGESSMKTLEISTIQNHMIREDCFFMRSLRGLNGALKILKVLEFHWSKLKALEVLGLIK